MQIDKPYHLFSEPPEYYNSMLNDIQEARRYVFLETFRFANDAIGKRFLHKLVEAAGRGVQVKLLLDYWGSSGVRGDFFNQLTEKGGEVRFFKKIKLNFDIFTKSHRRNHRKLLVIDDTISYIGSSNITGYNINWRESVLRMESGIASVFKKLFLQDFRIYDNFVISRYYHTKTINYYNFKIIRDVPNIALKKINAELIKRIRQSKRSIYIETPYFLPGFLFRRALMLAARRGVKITVVIPKRSDVHLIDILRNKYLGPLHKMGVRFLFYEPNNLHAKLMLIDDKVFALGSSNIDYRSFRYMFEIMLLGSEKSISEQIYNHVKLSMDQSIPFVFEAWKNRPFIDRFFEWLLIPFRHLL